MKKKAIEVLEPLKPKRRQGFKGTIQNMDEDTYIINGWKGKELDFRYCINLKTKEYMMLENGIWAQAKLYSKTADRYYPGECWRHYDTNMIWDDAEAAEQLRDRINEGIEHTWYKQKDLYTAIDRFELESNQNKRESAFNSKVKRLNEMLARTPMVDEAAVRRWAMERIGPQHMALKQKKECSCTKCGHIFSTNKKRGQTEECPQCKAILTVRNIRPEATISYMSQIGICQKSPMESIIRYFDVEVYDQFGKIRDININEAVRLSLDMYKRRGLWEERLQILYSQINKLDKYRTCGGTMPDRAINHPASVWKGNQSNRHITSGYMYPEGIRECLEGTKFEPSVQIIEFMAQKGIKADFNRIMFMSDDEKFQTTMEYLAKGRFYRLADELSGHVNFWGGVYRMNMDYTGEDIHEVLYLTDKQHINRFRELDGTDNMLGIFQWSEQAKVKLPQEVLEFIVKEKIDGRMLTQLTERIKVSPTAIVNYLKRQKKEGYPSKSYAGILNQWVDYLDMMKKLGKKLTDELFYKPKNLKERHDACVQEINERKAEMEMKDNEEISKELAKEYREKFPEAERILQEIKSKFEYSGENMSIVVPQDLSEIVLDGKTLHHCAGATNRYFDRIESRETYICFLRKNSNLQVPYYTIEVEPGGTIRQHRGLYDEEPELDIVKPFLKEWQKTVKRRMSEHDRKLAKISKIKREENIEDLKAKNNTFVLRGLMEDFMEA